MTVRPGASFRVSLSVDGGYLAAEIEDDARPFDPRRSVHAAELLRDLASRKLGGLGLRLVNALMEVVDYRWSDGYNRTILKTERAAIAGRVRTRGPMITIAEEQNGEVTVVDINGRVDSNTAKSFEEKLTGLFTVRAQSRCGRSSSTSSISAAPAAAHCWWRAGSRKKSDGRLALCNITADVMRVFELGGLTDFFAIYPSREEGLAKLA